MYVVVDTALFKTIAGMAEFLVDDEQVKHFIDSNKAKLTVTLSRDKGEQ